MRSGIIRNLFKKYPGVWKVALTALIISAVIYLSLEIARANESIQMLETSNERLVDKNEKLGIESKRLFELSQELSLRGDELTIKLENQEKEFVKLVDSNVSLQQAIEKRDAEIKRIETSYQKEVLTLKNKATELQRKINQQKVSQQQKTQSTKRSAIQPKVASVTQRVVSRATSSSSSKTITVSATAYTAFCNGCSGITATGINLRANPRLKVIAVDPRVIPLGSKVHVEGYGYAIAGDTGGAIKGNKIDLFMPSRSTALNFGRKTVSVKILNKK
jgi:3D (Asp-Asp-Asp) domain-containing protein